MTPSILLVEDDSDFAGLIEMALGEEGMQVTVAVDGESGWDLAHRGGWDLVLLDVMLPGLGGFDLCRRLREAGLHAPILMLTARDGEPDRVLGLELGADDYMPKTMGMRELVARVRAALRRASDWEGGGAEAGEVVRHGDLLIDPMRRRVIRGGEEVALTAKEFDLLFHFASHPGRVFRRDELLDAVWGHRYEGYQHTVNSHINRLRSKIEDDPRRPCLLLTVWGVGYRFADRPSS